MIENLARIDACHTVTPTVPVTLPEIGIPIWCKLEYLNPSGSTKDRIARFILAQAIKSGELKDGGCVVEASSGSTGIAFALASAQLGLKFIAIMPEGVSLERIKMIRAYGARVELTSADLGINGAIARAQEIARNDEAYWPHQFSNADNAKAHSEGTAAEAISQIPGGTVDIFVSGVGTGGTLVGVVNGLKQAGCNVTPVLARPISRSLISDIECCSMSTRIPGVVEGISKIFSSAMFENLLEIEVSDEDAIDTTQRLIRAGFPVGPSSGLNYLAAVQASRLLGGTPICLTTFPDRMERYFSTSLFD